MEETLIDKYIDKQALISAIERFSEKHDLKQFAPHQRIHKELIPKKAPGPGQQYAFEVDLDKCTGCKACVTACHNENGLDEDETWRTVGLIQGGTSRSPALQHVTSACHHCAEPACMTGCPTQAYEKDERTGVVKHLEDQCFGCQYCVLKCPYDVPKYNKKRGIVHKCDMCISRLDGGQAPACARACPNGAIRITIVDKAQVKAHAREFVNLPDSPASDYTYPTTRYVTQRHLPTNMSSVNYFSIQPEHSHLPLVFMLVLTQLSVGAFFVEYLFKHIVGGAMGGWHSPFHVPVALGLGLLAMGSSILHLGRPQYAFRAVLGLKTSWLSREILSFVVFAHSAMGYALCLWFAPLREALSGMLGGADMIPMLGAAVLLSGLAGVYCSVMVYKDTRRPFWDNDFTTVKFTLTMGVLGFATMFCVSIFYSYFTDPESFLIIFFSYGRTLCYLIAGIAVVKMIIESVIFFSLEQSDMTSFKKTALLMTRNLKVFTSMRFIFGFVGGIFLPFLLVSMNRHVGEIPILVSVALLFLFLLAGEMLERYLFFRAVVPLSMPGGKS